MRTHTLKINMKIHKDRIESDYFRTRDLFYRGIIVGILCSSHMSVEKLSEIVMEEPWYRDKYIQALNKVLHTGAKPIDLLNDGLSVTESILTADLVLDLSIYLTDFINRYHCDRSLNVYSVQIDDNHNLCVSMKKIRKPKII